MTDTLRLSMPQNMTRDTDAIFDGEYEVPGLAFAHPPRVLDIGACVGGFANWAALRWPGCSITCVEPNPKALVHLRENLPAGASLVEAAVTGSCMSSATIYDGKNNLGCAGLAPLSTAPEDICEEGMLVDTIPPASLPRAEIVKVDTEGCEVEILSGYDLSETFYVAYEWHRTEDRIILDALMRAQGFTLLGGITRNHWLGTCKWLRMPT